MRYCLILYSILCILAFAGSVQQAHAGKLDDIREEVSGDSGSAEDSDDSDDDDHSDDDDFFDDDDDFPYEGGRAPSIRMKKGPLKPSIRLGVEYAYDVDAVHRPGVFFLFDSPWYFGVESGWSFLLENVSGSLDRLVIGDTNISVRIISNKWFDLRAGVGARWMIDGDGLSGGFNFMSGVDIQPYKTLVISLSGDVGTLGKARVIHTRAMLGVKVSVFHIYAGYDLMRIGLVNMHGPIAGAHLWF